MKYFIALILMLAMGSQAALALPTADRLKTKLNQNVVASDGSLFRIGDQLTNKKAQVMKVTFDAYKTGATGYPLKNVGVHQLRDVDGSAATLPSGALIKEVWIDVRGSVQANSAAPKVCFQLQSGCDLKSGQSANAYLSTGYSAYRPTLPVDGTTIVRLTADRIVSAVVSGGALTGGTVNLFIEYFLP